MTDISDGARYARDYAARFGLVPIDEADAARLVALFDRASAAGAGVPRQTDKELEPYHPRTMETLK